MNRRNFLGIGTGLGLAAFALARPVLALTGSAGADARRPGSRFLPNVPVVTHLGEQVRFYDDCVRGKVVLINFILVECTDGACPTATANLRKVQDLLGARMGRDIFFYSITLQPEHDTPKVLKDYSANFGVKPGWKFLTGTRANIETLRRALGYAEADPVADQDVNTHLSMALYGDERLGRWGATSVNSSPETIASTFKWLSS